MVYGETASMLPLIKRARHNVCSPETRLGVYTKGYVLRLEGAVEVDYPALAHYIGKDAFEKAVVAYVKATPSVFWDLNLYSIGFADFLGQHSTDKAAHALARLESAIIDVFWLPDSKALEPAALAALSMDQLAGQVLPLRTACTLLALDYPAHAYLTAFREGNPPAVMEKKPEYICLIRSQNEVKRLLLDAEEYQLLALLERGETFGAALEQAENTERLLQQLPGYLTRWLDAGFFADFS